MFLVCRIGRVCRVECDNVLRNETHESISGLVMPRFLPRDLQAARPPRPQRRFLRPSSIIFLPKDKSLHDALQRRQGMDSSSWGRHSQSPSWPCADDRRSSYCILLDRPKICRSSSAESSRPFHSYFGVYSIGLSIARALAYPRGNQGAVD
jgi:hypothetical protein